VVLGEREERREERGDNVDEATIRYFKAVMMVAEESSAHHVPCFVIFHLTRQILTASFIDEQRSMQPFMPLKLLHEYYKEILATFRQFHCNFSITLDILWQGSHSIPAPPPWTISHSVVKEMRSG
jgi:hypothetical protein